MNNIVDDLTVELRSLHNSPVVLERKRYLELEGNMIPFAAASNMVVISCSPCVGKERTRVAMHALWCWLMWQEDELEKCQKEQHQWKRKKLSLLSSWHKARTGVLTTQNVPKEIHTLEFIIKWNAWRFSANFIWKKKWWKLFLRRTDFCTWGMPKK